MIIMMIMVLYCDRYNGYDQDLSMAMAVIVPAATNTFVPWTNKDHGFDEDGGFDGDFDNDLQSWDEFTSSQSQKPFPSVETLGKGGGQADHTEEDGDLQSQLSDIAIDNGVQFF